MRPLPKPLAFLSLAATVTALSVASLPLGAGTGQLHLSPPLVIAALLLFGFGRTLLPGRKPLVSALAAERHGILDAATARYTRRVTQMWTLFFTLMIAELLLLQRFAALETRLAFAYGINYVLIAVLFLAEFWLRRRCLPQIEHPSLGQYLRYIRRVPWSRLVTK